MDNQSPSLHLPAKLQWVRDAHVLLDDRRSVVDRRLTRIVSTGSVSSWGICSDAVGAHSAVTAHVVWFKSLMSWGILAGDVDLLAGGRVEGRVTVLLDAETETARVDVPVGIEQGDGEDRFREDIEDAVEDGLAVGSDDIATFGDPPANRVAEPDDEGDDAA